MGLRKNVEIGEVYLYGLAWQCQGGVGVLQRIGKEGLEKRERGGYISFCSFSEDERVDLISLECLCAFIIQA